MHRLTRLPRVIQPLSGSRYRFGIAQVCAVRTYATPAKPPSPNDAFANGGNSYYIDEMYRLWREDPKVVHASWNAYFSGMEKGLPSYKAFTPPPSFEATGIATLNLTGNKDLDIHLKVRKYFGLVLCSQAGLCFSGQITWERNAYREGFRGSDIYALPSLSGRAAFTTALLHKNLRVITSTLL